MNTRYILALFVVGVGAFAFRSGALRSMSRSLKRNSRIIDVSGDEQSEKKPINTTIENLILYDGVCKFCNTWVNVLLRLDSEGVFKFAALQSKIGKAALRSCNRENTDISSIVYIDGPVSLSKSVATATTACNTCYIKSEAIVRIVKRLGLPLHYISMLLPLQLKDGMYDIVAQNRYSLMGKYDDSECRLSDPLYDHRFVQ